MSALMILFLCGFTSLQAQSVEVTGTVIDANTNEALPGVNIIVEGTAIGTTTDIDGNFNLEVPGGENILVVSYVGYVSQRFQIDDQREFTIELSQQIGLLDEVVVVGYGTQERINLTGSIATASAESIENRPITTASQALQGITGAYVNQAGGQPGSDDATIRIRGVGTLGNSNPLVLVDGVEYSLRDVNPIDIESISVLKDAAAASIYGNRAANGVILITTKQGRQGEPLQASYSTYFGWQQPTVLPDMVRDAVTYMNVRNLASINEGQPLVYSDEEIEEYRNGTDPDLYPNTDWMDIMFKGAAIHEHNLRLSGGGEQTAYSFTVGYLSQDGVLIGTNAEKYSLNSNVHYHINDRLTIGGRVTATFWERNEMAIDASSMMNYINRALPIHPNLLADGRYGDTWLTTPGHNIFRHPVAMATEGVHTNESQRILGNIDAEYVLPLDIEYRINIAVNKQDVLISRFEPDIYYYNPKTDVGRRIAFDNRNAFRADNNNLNTTLFNTFSWNENITARSEVTMLVGASRETFTNRNFNARREGFFSNDLTDLNAGSINDVARGSTSKSALLSYFGRLNYNFSDKYMIEFNFRYDGSSRFAAGNRWGFFPSFSGAWRLDQESFMENLEAINEFKIRGSWGELGNQNIPLNSFVSTVNLGQSHAFNDNVVAGTAVTSLADPEISWEKTTITNIGLDIGLWENRLEFTADIFERETTDILTQINVPAQVGDLGGPVTNLYSMRNRGAELTANYRQFVSTDFSYNIGAGVAYVDNEVTFLDGDQHFSGNTRTGGRALIITEGHSVNSWYMLDAIGLFQNQGEINNHVGPDGTLIQPNAQPGDIKYRDVNGDGVIDGEDRIITGRTVPKYTFSFNLGFNYRGFAVRTFFQGVYDIDTYPQHNVAFPLYNGAGLRKDHLDFWTPDNPDAAFPRPHLPVRGSQANSQNSTFWLQDASFLRLKNLQVSYDIPMDRIGFRNLRIFANGQNLLTFTSNNYFDPEKEIEQTSPQTYPNTRLISIGANIDF